MDNLKAFNAGSHSTKVYCMLAVHYLTNTHHVQSRASVPFRCHGCLKGDLIIIGYPGFGAAGQRGGNGALGLPGADNNDKSNHCDNRAFAGLIHIQDLWYPGLWGGKGGSGGNAGKAILMAVLECQL